MTINKIICDICGHEIDMKVDSGMGIFKSMKMSTLNLTLMNSEKAPEVQATTFDLCQKCCSLLEKHCQLLQDEHKTKRSTKI